MGVEPGGPKRYHIMNGVLQRGGAPLLAEGPYDSLEAAGARCEELVAERRAAGMRSRFTVITASVVRLDDSEQVCLARDDSASPS